MTVDSVTPSFLPAQRLPRVRTPDTDFLEAVQAASGQSDSAATRPAVTSDTVSISVQARALGQTSVEQADRHEDPVCFFPPTDAPQAIVDAWNTATQGMDEGDKMTYAHIMHSYIHGIRIGDGPATGGMASDSIDSYRAAVGNYLDMLERLRGQLPEGQYERSKPFFDELRTLLAGGGTFNGNPANTSLAPPIAASDRAGGRL